MTRKQADTGRACWAIAKRLKREGNNIKIDLFGPPSRAQNFNNAGDGIVDD